MVLRALPAVPAATLDALASLMRLRSSNTINFTPALIFLGLYMKGTCRAFSFAMVISTCNMQNGHTRVACHMHIM